MIPYSPANWYWSVGGDASKVWSSAAAAYVAASDPSYQAWLAVGGVATALQSAADLVDALTLAAQPLGALPGAPGPILTFLQFMALFTPAEQAQIVASSDTQTRLFMLMATGAGAIALANPEVVAGVDYLATGPALIASARVAQILANQAPS